MPTIPSTRPRPRHGRVIAAIAVCITAACAGKANDRAGAVSDYRGVVLSAPLSKPSFTLTDFDGHPYDFVRATQGKVALLFFGYTHCPDVCPLHMANIAAVMKQMSWEERGVIQVVFVTTDPDRDTPQRLKEWLGNFDPSFVGLTGTKDELRKVQLMLGVAPAQREDAPGDSAGYFVGHAAQVFAFARDGYGYLEYPFGIRQEDWANDLPKLARDSTGATIRRELAAVARANSVAVAPPPGAAPEVKMGGMIVTLAVIPEPAAQSEAALYLTIRNDTPQEDTLVAVATEVAMRAELHETMQTGSMEKMVPLTVIPVPAHAETRLVPGARHVMLMSLRQKLAAGDSATLFLSFARAGSVEARAHVVKYSDLEKALAQDRSR